MVDRGLLVECSRLANLYPCLTIFKFNVLRNGSSYDMKLKIYFEKKMKTKNLYEYISQRPINFSEHMPTKYFGKDVEHQYISNKDFNKCYTQRFENTKMPSQNYYYYLSNNKTKYIYIYKPQ